MCVCKHILNQCVCKITWGKKGGGEENPKKGLKFIFEQPLSLLQTTIGPLPRLYSSLTAAISFRTGICKLES